jgi:16S rRNA (uracil1498-N3)-methyltransferase
MALRRFYIQPDQLLENQVHLKGELVHHIADVCRFSVGDQFEVLTGDGLAHLVEIEQQTSREILAKVLSQRQIAAPTKPDLVLCLSIPKLPKVDWIVEKSVELGVSEIRPFVSDFSFLRQVSEISQNRVARWTKLVQGATQQSGRGELMKIGPAVTLKNLLGEFRSQINRGPGLSGLFLYEGEAPLGLGEAIEQIKGRDPEQLWVFVGSEGGFSPGEVASFSDAGLTAVSMGHQILRVETACLAIGSIIKYEFGTLR